jgi:heme A synthase
MKTATLPATKFRWNSGWIVIALWVVTFLGARAVLDKDLVLPTWIKVTAALVPILPTALFLWVIVSSLREMDELHRKVHLESLVIAYPLAILMLVTLGFLQLAIELPPEDWSYRHVWPFLPCFYFLGLAIAWRRYR